MHAGTRLCTGLLAAAFWARSATAADFTGMWQLAHPMQALRTDSGAVPPLRPKAAKLYQSRLNAARKGDRSWDPALRCKPLGIPRAFMEQGWPFEWMQSAGRVDMLFQWNRLDRALLVSDKFVPSSDTIQDSGGPYYLGASIGHWDGDSFVTSLKNEDEATLLDPSGLPHSDMMTIAERFSLTNGGKRLRDRLHIVDPATYTAPWDATLVFERAPQGREMREDVCIERLKLNSFATIDNSLNR